MLIRTKYDVGDTIEFKLGDKVSQIDKIIRISFDGKMLLYETASYDLRKEEVLHKLIPCMYEDVHEQEKTVSG